MDSIKQFVEVYLTEWNNWVTQSKSCILHNLKPMHVGWKVTDELALGQKAIELLPFTKEGHVGTVDNRKIILLALNEPIEGIPILQLMQLRPNSSDPLGLDHVAFYCSEMKKLEEAFRESSYEWEHQNNPGHEWISLWFGDEKREAKFFDHTSFDLGARALVVTSEAIKAGRTD